MAAGGRKGGGRARGFVSETCSPFAGAWFHGHTQLQESLGSDAEPRQKGCRRIREQSCHTALGKKPRNRDHYFPRATAFDTAHPKITTAPPPKRKAWPPAACVQEAFFWAHSDGFSSVRKPWASHEETALKPFWWWDLYHISHELGRRKRQPTPAFLPGKSHGPGSLAGCSPCSRQESDTA